MPASTTQAPVGAKAGAANHNPRHHAPPRTSREAPTEKERADAWLSRINAAHAARDVIRMLYDAVGGSAIYAQNNPLDLALRDAETWCQHLAVQRRTLEWVGALLLKSDGPPAFPFL